MANQTMKLAVLSGILALTLAPCANADDGASASMLSNTCAGCHGTNGNSVGPASPTIAGMDPIVFVETMEGFKSDEIYSTIMGRIAKGYETTDFEKMATFFKGQEFVAAKQSFDEAQVKQGAKLHDKYCEKCHAEGGKITPDEEEYYILAGQWTPYLKYSMADFLEGTRTMPKKMKKKVEKMMKKDGDANLAALYAFYASQQ